jgi:hypothetical protein
VLLVVNDHVLKYRWPGVVTGKLSDLVGVFLLPVLALGAWELCGLSHKREVCLLGIAVTAIGFAAVKLTPLSSSAYGAVVGLLRWPLLGHWAPITVTQDATDLLVLPVLALSWIVGARSWAPTGSDTER